MEIQHELLVYLPYISSDGDDKNTLKVKAAAYAETVLKRFKQSVYTKATPSPLDKKSNVLLCAEDMCIAIQKLKNILKFQRSEIMYCLKCIENTGDTFETIIHKLYTDADETIYSLPMEHIRCISQFLAGEYQMSSKFYNTWKKTARLLPKDLVDIEKAPQDWALVSFVLER